ncbi:amidohydrolase family protein [Chryseolinea lacunae]|uniref:Amidohydrolase family protein n=1 Tax=Chryseolinea lacunae TaxID=2801331 RepID=A0ABS1L1B2_9BACT|nr:amidohydrolase family protein [Chryseolinea lacunae]MBL0745302.1 amidohydrolase family protein [Chryseolinea lacunae]
MKKTFTILLMWLATGALAQTPDQLLLKNYRPKSIYNIPVTKIEKAKYPVIDMHSHPYGKTNEDLKQWIKTMDKMGIEKTLILSYATGAKFDSIYQVYSKFGDRFEVWCGFDHTGFKEPGWIDRAVKELERCARVGAKGVGELGDKGLGEFYSSPTPAWGMHIDDPRMRPLWKKCAELRLPVNVHVAEPMWMYEKMDSTNDGLMNAYIWRVDQTKPGLLTHAQLIGTLEKAVRENPATTFVACHYANCEYDLSILGNLLGKYPNLYADISARYAETATIPRYMNTFLEKHQDKIVYGTDMGADPEMYAFTFRILESKDEHFYATEMTGYHWPLHGFGLSDAVLKKVYQTNAKKILKR